MGEEFSLAWQNIVMATILVSFQIPEWSIEAEVDSQTQKRIIVQENVIN